MPRLPLDTLSSNEIPEGLDLGLRVAGPAPRALAFVIDFGIRVLLFAGIASLISVAGFGAGLILISLFLLEWLYPVFYEALRGATPGKRAMGLIVVHDDGTPVDWSASLIRNLMRTVDFLPAFYLIGLISTLVDRDFRRLGDLAAGTLVVHVKPARRPAPLPDVAAIAPPPGLTSDTQQAIVAFAERAGQLSQARREELAGILGATLLGLDEPRAQGDLDLVLGYARWLVGSR